MDTRGQREREREGGREENQDSPGEWRRVGWGDGRVPRAAKAPAPCRGGDDTAVGRRRYNGRRRGGGFGGVGGWDRGGKGNKEKQQRLFAGTRYGRGCGRSQRGVWAVTGKGCG